MTQETIPGELGAIHQRLDDGDKRMSSIESALTENTEATKRIEANTADLLDFFAAAKGAFKVLGWIGKLAKPISYVAAAGAAVIGFWAAIKGGGIGPK